MKSDEFFAEYGVSMDVAGARVYCRRAVPGSACTPIDSARQYVRICRRIASARGVELPADGRIIAAGWNRVSPRAWVGSHDEPGKIADWVRYYGRAVARPEKVGSSKNVDVDTVAMLRELGVSPGTVRRFGEAEFFWCSIFPLAGALSRGCSPAHVGRNLARRKRQAYRISIAASRAAFRVHDLREVSWSPKVMAVFGRMSPELQHAAMVLTVRALPDGQRRVMPRHLPWSAIADVQRQMIASPRVRAAWALGVRRNNMAAAFGGVLAPSYPRCSLDVQARICRGETPVEVSDGVLTRREAHGWLSEGWSACASEWLIQALSHALPGQPCLRSPAVARWATTVNQAGQWEQLTRSRTIAGPGGQRVSVRYIDRIDEIMDEDLIRGAQTTVAEAFQHAAERAGEAYQKRLMQDHRTLCRMPSHWRPYHRCMRLLATPHDLAREGEEQKHCVGTYVSAVESGRSVIFSILVAGPRSTVELSPSGDVRQHFGARNTNPHPLCDAVLERFLRFRV